MEFYQVVGLSLVIAMAFVVDSTVKLFRYRRRNKDTLEPVPFRDLAILARPSRFTREEARLTYRNWISCAATVVLITLFLALSPEGTGSVGGVSGPADSAG